MKWIISVILGSLLVLVACSDDTLKTESEPATSTSEKENGEDHINYLMNLQMEMISVVRKHVKTVSAYEVSQGETGDRDEAVQASNRIANELRGIEVPAEINSALQTDMKDSIELLALYFEERAAAISSGGDKADMEAALGEFHEKIGATFESVGLLAPNFGKDLY